MAEASQPIRPQVRLSPGLLSLLPVQPGREKEGGPGRSSCLSGSLAPGFLPPVVATPAPDIWVQPLSLFPDYSLSLQ